MWTGRYVCGAEYEIVFMQRYRDVDACGAYPDKYYCVFSNPGCGLWYEDVVWCPYCGPNRECPE
jgi:hypothetical protein